MNVLVADDHEVVRRGVRDILADEFKKIVIGEAKNSREVLELAAQKKWDLILLDILMPGSNIIDLLRDIRAINGSVPILILTAMSEGEYAVRTLKAGANGYITKQYASDELVYAIKKIIAGEPYLSKEAVAELTATLHEDNDSGLPHKKLSPRELEIFCLIAKGKSVKEIAGDLQCSDKTVGTHVARIKEKTGLASYVEITRYALQNQLVE